MAPALQDGAGVIRQLTVSMPDERDRRNYGTDCSGTGQNTQEINGYMK